MNSFKISIIVPVYRVEKYLDKCVESIINQTYSNLEIILVDDGSPDNCPSMCDRWAKKDERIKAIHKENGGVSSARNAGLDIATGEYIGFVDSDDWIEPDMYRYLIQFANENNADISRVSGWFHCNQDMIPFRESEEFVVLSGRDKLVENVISNSYYANIWTGIYKKQLFDNVRFDENLMIAEDWLINYQLNSNAKIKVLSPKLCYHYVQHPQSALHSSSIDRLYDQFKVIDFFWMTESTNKDLKKCICQNYTKIALEHMKRLVESDREEDDQYKKIRRELIKKRKELLLSGVSTRTFLKLFLVIYCNNIFIGLIKKKRS